MQYSRAGGNPGEARSQNGEEIKNVARCEIKKPENIHLVGQASRLSISKKKYAKHKE
ncbi:MAG: hypothetical protein U9N08_08575 [Candidatus Caldatribacteriota bacterium]|nr:hypothetical protein [Candidatus Caldatribacteriota bacterium]